MSTNVHFWVHVKTLIEVTGSGKLLIGSFALQRKNALIFTALYLAMCEAAFMSLSSKKTKQHNLLPSLLFLLSQHRQQQDEIRNKNASLKSLDTKSPHDPLTIDETDAISSPSTLLVFNKEPSNFKTFRNALITQTYSSYFCVYFSREIRRRNLIRGCSFNLNQEQKNVIAQPCFKNRMVSNMEGNTLVTFFSYENLCGQCGQSLLVLGK